MKIINIGREIINRTYYYIYCVASMAKKRRGAEIHTGAALFLTLMLVISGFDILLFLTDVLNRKINKPSSSLFAILPVIFWWAIRFYFSYNKRGENIIDSYQGVKGEITERDKLIGLFIFLFPILFFIGMALAVKFCLL